MARYGQHVSIILMIVAMKLLVLESQVTVSVENRTHEEAESALETTTTPVMSEEERELRQKAEEEETSENNEFERDQIIDLQLLSGFIRGLRVKYRSTGELFDVFKGIPYAAEPVGALRFQKPIEPAKWKGIRNATQFSPMCPQKEGRRFDDRQIAFLSTQLNRAQEDCLYLNVFGPALQSNTTLPVIFWIHGGGFQTGSGSDYRMGPILKKFGVRQVVFVTVNYRLGPMGFLSTGDKLLPGNNGLWDLLEALKWVKSNIHFFRGDSKRVALTGHGSGAQAASILALSNHAVVVLMSGTAISPGAVRGTAEKATVALAKHLNCRADNSTEIWKCVRDETWENIVNAPRIVFDDYEEWVPRVDGDLIEDFPEQLAHEGRGNVPAIIGTTKNESALSLILLKGTMGNMSDINKDKAEELVENLTSAYSGFTNHDLITMGSNFEYVVSNSDPKMTSEILQDGVLKMYSNFWFDAPAARLGQLYTLKGKTDVYLYSFDQTNENLEHPNWKGAFHGLDVILLFDQQVSFVDKRQDMNWQAAKTATDNLAQLLVNFATEGEPTPPSAYSYFPEAFNWTKLNPTKMNYLSITDRPTMQVGYNWRGHMFWNSYARSLDSVDVGNKATVAALEKALGDYQMATWILLFCTLFLLAILVGLACYCTRKDSDEEDHL